MPFKRKRAIRRYFRMKRHHRRTKMTIPLALVGGFAPAAIHTVQGFRQSGFTGALEFLAYDLTGYSTTLKTWSAGALVKGWTPIIAGVLTHKLAGILGINRALGRFGVPLIRI